MQTTFCDICYWAGYRRAAKDAVIAMAIGLAGAIAVEMIGRLLWRRRQND